MSPPKAATEQNEERPRFAELAQALGYEDDGQGESPMPSSPQDEEQSAERV